MKRNTTIIALCGLFLIADAVTFRHTLSIRDGLTTNMLSVLLFAEVLAAMLLIWLAAAIRYKDTKRRKRSVKAGKRLVIVRP